MRGARSLALAHDEPALPTGLRQRLAAYAAGIGITESQAVALAVDAGLEALEGKALLTKVKN
jgi:hypothetical protein